MKYYFRLYFLPLGKSNQGHKVSQVKSSRALQLLDQVNTVCWILIWCKSAKGLKEEEATPVHTTDGSALKLARLVLEDFIAYWNAVFHPFINYSFWRATFPMQ